MKKIAPSKELRDIANKALTSVSRSKSRAPEREKDEISRIADSMTIEDLNNFWGNDFLTPKSNAGSEPAQSLIQKAKSQR